VSVSGGAAAAGTELTSCTANCTAEVLREWSFNCRAKTCLATFTKSEMKQPQHQGLYLFGNMAATLIQINRDTQRYDEMLRYVDATFCFCFCF